MNAKKTSTGEKGKSWVTLSLVGRYLVIRIRVNFPLQSIFVYFSQFVFINKLHTSTSSSLMGLRQRSRQSAESIAENCPQSTLFRRSCCVQTRVQGKTVVAFIYIYIYMYL